jgi:hypothetical protein
MFGKDNSVINCVVIVSFIWNLNMNKARRDLSRAGQVLIYGLGNFVYNSYCNLTSFSFLLFY